MKITQWQILYCWPMKITFDFIFFISHMTYCMQPLNLGIFQFYRHWYNVVIQKPFAKFNTEYLLIRFFQNFIKISSKFGTIFSKHPTFGLFSKNLICGLSMEIYVMNKWKNLLAQNSMAHLNIPFRYCIKNDCMGKTENLLSFFQFFNFYNF